MTNGPNGVMIEKRDLYPNNSLIHHQIIFLWTVTNNSDPEQVSLPADFTCLYIKKHQKKSKLLQINENFVRLPCVIVSGRPQPFYVYLC